MSEEATINLEFLGRQILTINEELREIRKENQTLLEAMLLNQRTITGLDRRLSDWKDELNLTIKMELGGATTNLTTRTEQAVSGRVSEVWEALERIFLIAALEGRPSFEALLGEARKVIEEHKVRDLLDS